MPKCCGKTMTSTIRTGKFLRVWCEQCDGVVYVKQHVSGEMEALEKLTLDAERHRVAGHLTKDDMMKLKGIALRSPSPHRKPSFKTWDCRACGHSVYFKVIRCTLCESGNVKETVRATQYELREEFLIEHGDFVEGMR